MYAGLLYPGLYAIVVAPAVPPANTTAATAIVIPALPYSTTQEVNAGGVTYDVWYTYTPTDCIDLIGIVAHGGASAYTPRAEVYVGPASAPVVWHNNSGDNDASQVPVVPGTEYFLRFRTNTGNPTPALLSLSVTAGPTGTAPAGSLVIADDTPGYPAIVVDATTGTVLRSVYPFPAGEEGDSLPGGTVLMADPYDTATFRLYSPTFALIASIPFLGSDYARVRATPAAGLYYIADGGLGATPPTVGTVTPTGTLGATTWTLPAGGAMGALAGNNTGTILYYTHPSTDATLRRWDLVADVGLSDLVAAITDHVVPDILMLADGSIVVGYWKGLGSPKNYTVTRYHASGTVLNTYEFGSNFSMVPRLGYSTTSGAFWVYSQPETGTYDGYARLFEVRATDGVNLTTLTVPQYVAGAYEPPITGATPVPFGVSPSCPIFPLWAPLPACGEAPPVEDEGGPGPLAWIEWRQRIGSSEIGAARIDTWVTHSYSDHDMQCPPTYYHGFKEARVESFGEASRTLSDARTGDWQGARCELRLSDYDRVLRTRLASETERFWTTGLVTMRIVARDVRAALGQPLTVFVGPIRRATPAPPLSIDLQLEDHAGHAMLNDELLIPQRLVDPLRFPTIALADSAKAHPEPIVYGIHSREAGAYAPIYLGRDGEQHVWMVAGHYAAVTDICLDGVSVLGTDGVDWSVPGGAGPAYEDVDGRRYTLLRGKAGQSAADTTPVLYKDNLGPSGAYFETWVAGFSPVGGPARFNVNETTGVHSGSRCIHGVDLRAGDFAIGTFGATGAPGHAVPRGYMIENYAELVLFIRNETAGWLAGKLHLRFARLSDPAEPVGDLVEIVDGSYGLDTFDVTTYQELRIPIADFGDLTDIRAEHLVILKSGVDEISLAIDDITLEGGTIPDAELTPADQAASGAARLTLNVHGWTTTGDTGGPVITDIFQQYQHFLINYVANAGGYLTGPPLPNPPHDLFDRVVTTVKEASFAAASALAVTRYPPTGYEGRGVLGATPSDRRIVRDWISRWNVSADCRFGVTRFGELMVVLSAPTAADRDAAPLYDEVLDLLQGSFEVDVQWDNQGTEIPYRADFNWATEEWVVTGDVADAVASENYGQAPSGIPHPPRDLWFVGTAAQAINVAEHELRRVKDPPKVLTFDVPIVHPAGHPLVQRELGSYIRVQHFAGIGPGEIRLLQLEMVSVWPGTRRLRVRAVDVEDLIVDLLA